MKGYDDARTYVLMDVSLPYPYVVYKVAKFTDCRRYANKKRLWNIHRLYVGCREYPSANIKVFV